MRGERETLGPGVSSNDKRDSGIGPGRGNSGPHPLGSPTVNLPSRDTLIIHDDPATTHMLPGYVSFCLSTVFMIHFVSCSTDTGP